MRAYVFGLFFLVNAAWASSYPPPPPPAVGPGQGKLGCYTRGRWRTGDACDNQGCPMGGTFRHGSCEYKTIVPYPYRSFPSADPIHRDQ